MLKFPRHLQICQILANFPVKTATSALLFTSNFNDGCFATIDGGGSVLFGVERQDLGTENSTMGYFNKEKNRTP